jgi:hypothetical protein
MVKTNYFFSTPVVPIGLDVGLTNMLMSFWTFYLSRCCLDIVLFNHIYVKKLLMYLIIHPKKKIKPALSLSSMLRTRMARTSAFL